MNADAQRSQTVVNATMGHAAIDRLLRRHRLLTTLLDPETIEQSWAEDQAGRSWGAVCSHVFGEVFPTMQSNAHERSRIAHALVDAIDRCQPRQDHYPLGWQEDAAAVRGQGRPTAKEAKRDLEQERADAAESVRYCASYRSRDAAELYEELGVTEGTITKADGELAIATWGAAGGTR